MLSQISTPILRSIPKPVTNFCQIMRNPQIVAAAKAIWETNSMNADWDKMRPEVHQMYIQEATAAINAFFGKGPRVCFVFGSNLAGIHGAGAARAAFEDWGAERGVGVGPTGMAYAIPTKDENINTLPLSDIAYYIDDFLMYVDKHPEIQFLVTRVGCGLAGYKDEDIAPMFFGAPRNVQFSTSWNAILDTLTLDDL
jgi:hypothetical protein